MRQIELTIPRWAYTLIMLAWAAGVFGVAAAYAHHLFSQHEADLIVSPPTVMAVSEENQTLHLRITELESELASLDR